MNADPQPCLSCTYPAYLVPTLLILYIPCLSCTYPIQNVQNVQYHALGSGSDLDPHWIRIFGVPGTGSKFWSGSRVKFLLSHVKKNKFLEKSSHGSGSKYISQPWIRIRNGDLERLYLSCQSQPICPDRHDRRIFPCWAPCTDCRPAWTCRQIQNAM